MSQHSSFFIQMDKINTVYCNVVIGIDCYVFIVQRNRGSALWFECNVIHEIHEMRDEKLQLGKRNHNKHVYLVKLVHFST